MSESTETHRHKWVVAICQICGFEVDFGHKTKPIPNTGTKAEYKLKNGKHLLKIGRRYVEVEPIKDKKGYLRVMPIWKK